jgi:hypothetical protein
MAVVSPFINDAGAAWLSEQTGELVAVVSRPDELNQLVPDTLKRAGQWFTLDEVAETEDGEEPEHLDTIGLHAKVYVAEKSWWTRLYLGSANATRAALIRRNNTEILVELVGRTSRIGGIATLLSEDGFGSVLSEYMRPEEMPQPDDKEQIARKALEAARNLLAEIPLKLICRADEDDWRLTLTSSQKLPLEGISQFKAWPITVSEDNASDTMGLAKNSFVDLGKFSTQSVTSLIAFEFVAGAKKMSLRMVLNIPVDGLPENRDDEIYKMVLKNQEGFLRYILLILGEYAEGIFGKGQFFDRKKSKGPWSFSFNAETPILEELARAFSRNPDKLKDVKSVVERLTGMKLQTSLFPLNSLNCGLFLKKRYRRLMIDTNYT